MTTPKDNTINQIEDNKKFFDRPSKMIMKDNTIDKIIDGDYYKICPECKGNRSTMINEGDGSPDYQYDCDYCHASGNVKMTHEELVNYIREDERKNIIGDEVFIFVRTQVLEEVNKEIIEKFGFENEGDNEFRPRIWDVGSIISVIKSILSNLKSK